MTESLLRAQAKAWLAEGRPAMLVCITETRGSTPRNSGARMVVSAEAVLGTLGGGQLEHRAIARARALLEEFGTGFLAPVVDRYALGPSLGQCCGGALLLQTSMLTCTEMAAWELPAPLFHLELHGAGHVGRAVARLLADVECRVRWIDERCEEWRVVHSTLAPCPHIERVATDDAVFEVSLAPPGACHLVLTHSHDLDFRIVERLLRRNDFTCLGLIGSETKRARFAHRLEQRGINPALIRRMACPVGLPGIESKEPAVLAVSVVAQLLQMTHQGVGHVKA